MNPSHCVMCAQEQQRAQCYLTTTEVKEAWALLCIRHKEIALKLDHPRGGISWEAGDLVIARPVFMRSDKREEWKHPGLDEQAMNETARMTHWPIVARGLAK